MKKVLLSCFLLAASATAMAAPQAEKLDRGVIAVKMTNGVFVSWRSLESDAKTMTFDVYRDDVKVNSEPITKGTNFTDPNGTVSSKYVIKALNGSSVVETSKTTPVEPSVFKRVHLDRPEGGTFAGNSAMGTADYPLTDDYDYSPNDCSLGDVDGDGEYEIFVKWDPSNSRDNSLNGYTGNVYIDCYKLDGTKLWRIDLGRNIRAGAHYTQYLVYDFDGDGKAELCCKTAPGTIDGQGKKVIMGSDDPDKSYVNSRGHVISGPEYLTVFNGQTGAEMSTVAFNPPRSIRTATQWGAVQVGTQKSDQTNRPERYLAAVAYLDGQKPSIVMCRGYYTASYLCAWDFDGTKLTQRWLHKSETKNEGLYGEGAHSLTVGDVDGDGCDEIVYGAACVDHDGSVLYTTRGGHGDALHLGDFLPDRPGLEVFMVHEEKDKSYPFDAELRDAATGEIIWKKANTKHDIGRGLAGDITDNFRGYEFWCEDWTTGASRKVVYDINGNEISTKQYDMNFRIYWDGDLLDELFDGRYDKTSKAYNPRITKPNATLTGTTKTWTIGSLSNPVQKAYACNTTKGTACLQADLFGDWREEVVLWDGENSSDLLIYTTTIATDYRVPCLMQDHNYRMAIAWQNVGYNQPPHLGYYLPDRFSTAGVITVSEGAPSQSLEIGYAIAPISGSYDKATTVVATGLPEGVKLDVDQSAQTFVISGTPTTPGTYKVVLSTKGGDPETSMEFTITVSEAVQLDKVAYFSFEEVGPSVTNHIFGTAAASGTSALASVAGVAGNGVSFDGTNHLIQAAYPEMQMGTKDFTLEMWFNSTDDAAYIFHKGSMAKDDTKNTSGNWIGLELKGGNLKFAIDDDVTKSEASFAATSYFNGQWHHLVCVRESATKTLKAYVDGKLVAEAPDNTGAINDNDERIVVANSTNEDNFYKGLMDELSVYTGAMSANKVAERFANRGVESGICDVTVSDAPKYLTLVDASTGIIVARGVGEPENVTSSAAPGVYILVIEQNGVREVRKVIL